MSTAAARRFSNRIDSAAHRSNNGYLRVVDANCERRVVPDYLEWSKNHFYLYATIYSFVLQNGFWIFCEVCTVWFTKEQASSWNVARTCLTYFALSIMSMQCAFQWKYSIKVCRYDWCLSPGQCPCEKINTYRSCIKVTHNLSRSRHPRDSISFFAFLSKYDKKSFVICSCSIHVLSSRVTSEGWFQK